MIQPGELLFLNLDGKDQVALVLESVTLENSFFACIKWKKEWAAPGRIIHTDDVPPGGYRVMINNHQTSFIIQPENTPVKTRKKRKS
jgi:hypothetical protein